MFLKTPVELTEHERSEIENYVMSSWFPWYRAPEQTLVPIDPRVANQVVNAPYFCHTLMRRSEVENHPGEIVSPSYKFFEIIFLRWCITNNIKVNTIYRACLNLVTYAPGEFSVPHVDHTFPHNNWIMYLNDVDRVCTLLFDNNMVPVEEIETKAYTSVAFSQQQHAHQYPKGTDHRFVLVFTWK